MTSATPPGHAPNPEPIPEFAGRPSSVGQQETIKTASEYWYKFGNEALTQALGRADDAAKQLITLNGTLQGLYLAAFAFSNLRQQVASGWLLPFFVPVALWLGSLYLASLVFVPYPNTEAAYDADDFSENAWLKIRDAYTKAYTQLYAKKLGRLHWAHRLLALGFAWVLILLVALAFLPASPAGAPTRVILLTPTPGPLPPATP